MKANPARISPDLAAVATPLHPEAQPIRPAAGSGEPEARRPLSVDGFSDTQSEHAFSQAHDWARARLSALAGDRFLDEQALRWIEGEGRSLCARLAQANRRGDLNALFDWLRQALPDAEEDALSRPARLRSGEQTAPLPLPANATVAQASSALENALAWRETVLAQRWQPVEGLSQQSGGWGELLGPLAAEAEALRLGAGVRDAQEWALRSRHGAQIFSWRAAAPRESEGSEANAHEGPAGLSGSAYPQLLASCQPATLSALATRSPGSPAGPQLAAALALARHQARLAGSERLRVDADSQWFALGLECLPGGLVRQQRDAVFGAEEISASLAALEAVAADPASSQAPIAVPGFCSSLLALAPQALQHPSLASRLDALATRADPQAWARLALSACALGWLSPLRAAAKHAGPLDRSAQEALLHAALWAATQDLPDAAELLARWAAERQPEAAVMAFDRAQQAGAHRAAHALAGIAQTARKRARAPAWIKRLAFWRKAAWVRASR